MEQQVAASVNISEKPPKLKKGFTIKWSSMYVSQSASYVILSYLTLYATDVMGLNAGAVGIAIMLSKLLDGVSDILVGILIDRTNGRFGKARPYSLGIVGYWICIGLMFSAPSMSQFAGIIYLFVMYTLIYSVFCTFFACAEAPYMANVLDDSRQSMTLISVGGIVTAIASIAFGILLPQMIASAGTDPAGWSRMAWILAIPMALVGTIRFFTIKEKKEALARDQNRIEANSTNGQKEKVRVKDLVGSVMRNKYILITAVLALLAYFGSGLSQAVGTYYTKYIFGDIGINSTMSMATIPLIFAMVAVPALSRKFSFRKVTTVMMLLSIVGGLIRLFDVKSVPLAFLGLSLGNLGFPAFYCFVNAMVLDCMEYGRWKTGQNVQGTVAALPSLMNKLGNAFASGASGGLLAIAGYNGLMAVQSESASSMIIAMATFIPAALGVVFIIILQFYNLENKMPEIRKDLSELDGQNTVKE